MSEVCETRGSSAGVRAMCWCYIFLLFVFSKLVGKRTGSIDVTTAYLRMQTEQKVYLGTCPGTHHSVRMETLVFAECVMSATISFLLTGLLSLNT